MLELRCLSSFKISKFSQKSWKLNQYNKNLIIVGIGPMNESFKSSIILSNWIKFELFQELPILCELMLGFRIVQDAKDFNTGYEIIQSLPISTLLVLKCQLINLTQRKRLLFYQFNDLFTYIFLAINYIWVNRWPSFFTHLVKFRLLNTFQSLFIYACN